MCTCREQKDESCEIMRKACLEVEKWQGEINRDTLVETVWYPRNGERQ